MATGIVKWWNADRGYGYLAEEGQEDTFIHRGALDDADSDLREGDTVIFTPMQGNVGRLAIEARKENPQLEF